MNSKQIAELITKNVLERVSKASSKHAPKRPDPSMLMSTRVPGGEPSSDHVLAYMLKRSIPLTRANYLDLNYPDGVPTESPGELEASLPAIFRRWQS